MVRIAIVRAGLSHRLTAVEHRPDDPPALAFPVVFEQDRHGAGQRAPNVVDRWRWILSRLLTLGDGERLVLGALAALRPRGGQLGQRAAGRVGRRDTAAAGVPVRL